MGFFSDLKEDLSQAVNELVAEEEQEAVHKFEEPVEIIQGAAEPESFVPETAEELGRMLDNMDLDRMVLSGVHETAEGLEDKPVETAEYPALEGVKTEQSEEEPEEASEEAVEPEYMENEPEETEEYPEETDERLSKGQEEVSENIIEEQEEEVKVREEEMQVEETQNNGMEAADSQLTGEVVEETAVITAGMTIRGDISSQGSLDIVGTVEGNIDILGKLNITGNIEGSSKAGDVYAEKARINGDIHSSSSIKIGQSTIIIGNIYATSAVIAGAVKGDIDVKGPVILDTSAIVMGNIKSKSVQINNGAVIEGLCSQCYADVNPSSFFEDLKKARK